MNARTILGRSLRENLVFCLGLGLGVTLGLGACSKEDRASEPGGAAKPEAAAPAKTPEAAAPANAPAPTPAPGASLAPEARQALDQAFAAYERVRAELVADKTDGVTAAARELETHARKAQAGAPAALAPHLEAMAAAAATLATAGDLAAARKAFGEVSRAAVALLAAEPALGEGKHVFECGMAEGYGKWIQPTADLANPYMGTRMPACGTASSAR